MGEGKETGRGLGKCTTEEQLEQKRKSLKEIKEIADDTTEGQLEARRGRGMGPCGRGLGRGRGRGFGRA
jgi:hypothetical protein